MPESGSTPYDRGFLPPRYVARLTVDPIRFRLRPVINTLGSFEVRPGPTVSRSALTEHATHERVALSTVTMMQELVVPSSRREMLALWVRNGISIAMLLAIPTLFPLALRAVNPNFEREEIARVQEREQRSGGERVVLPSGEVRRAIVYTAARPDPEDSPSRRASVWWSRVMAAVLLIATIRRTLQLRRARAAHAVVSSRPLRS